MFFIILLIKYAYQNIKSNEVLYIISYLLIKQIINMSNLNSFAPLNYDIDIDVPIVKATSNPLRK